MAGLVTDWYENLLQNKSDPRTADWPMMSSPWPTLTACASFVYFSKVLGPAMMANRKPFKLRNILVFYNAFQMLFSSWIFYEYLMSGWWGHYNFRCQPVDYSNSSMALRMAATCWWYYFSKFTEFFDTVELACLSKLYPQLTIRVFGNLELTHFSEYGRGPLECNLLYSGLRDAGHYDVIKFYNR